MIASVNMIQLLILYRPGFLSNDIKDYWYVSQGKLTVPSIDDREDMQFANEAFDILGFSEEMKYNVRISNGLFSKSSSLFVCRCSRTPPA